MSEKWPRVWSGPERAVRHAICKVKGHVPVQGRNGWEYLGTGYFCPRCNDMVTRDGKSFDFVKYVRQRARARFEPSITCPECGKTSYHPEDIRAGYCGYCRAFTGSRA